MNPVQTLLAGIAPDHVPALLAVLLLPLLPVLLRRLTGGLSARPAERSPASGNLVDRWAAALLAVSCAVHLALPLGHHDSPLLTVGFLGSGIAYGWLALRAREGKRWRLGTVLLVVATLVGYLVVVGAAGEEPDQVGIATALVELAALGFALVPLRTPARPRRAARFWGSAGTVTAVVVVGAVIWVGSFLAHRANPAAASPAAGAAPVVGLDHEHAHEHAARAQAGVIMRPLGANDHATAAQQQAAAELAAATKQATARYADLNAALAAGYRLPPVKSTGPDVHLENKAFAKDGRTLDPARPEMLVYAIDGGRATLLGVVFVMEVAGAPGPAPGGPGTRWHAHNLCVSLLPPGLGIVSPYGGCPAFSLNLTSGEMMHVWVVDNPGGPFAEGLDAAWVRGYHATHGLAVAGGTGG